MSPATFRPIQAVQMALFSGCDILYDTPTYPVQPVPVARYLDHTTTLSKGKSGLRCGSPTMLLPSLWRVVSVARTIYRENETIISIHIDDI